MKFDPPPDVAGGFFYYPIFMRCIRILIVDDMPEVRDGLRALLRLAAEQKSLSIEVIGEARNGTEAVQQATGLRPDVILMDLEMPVLDGYTAAHLIKAQLPCCRIIALSIHEDSASRQKAWQAGMDAFIPKGTSARGLLDAICHSEYSPQSFEPQEGENS